MTGGSAIRRLAPAGLALVALSAAVGVALWPVLDIDVFFYLLIGMPFAIVGALLAWHRSANPIGWLFLAFGLTTSFSFLWSQIARRVFDSHDVSRLGDVATLLGTHFWHPSFGLFVFSVLLFPNGRLLSPRWRWVAGAAVVIYGGMAVAALLDTEILSDEFPQARPLFGGAAGEVGTLVFAALLTSNLVFLPLTGVSLALRLRGSRGEERQQVKLFAYTVTMVLVAFPISVLIVGDGRFGVFLLPLIPISAGAAILKYRLYDIDLVVNRALVYGALTATLAGAYLASVLALQWVLSPDSSLAVAASTLAVAALFRPLRARIQRLVDRRFYRRRYDAQRTLEAFSARLRDEVALEALSQELRAAVRETIQPAHVSLWLRAPR